jgi:hypothetical protein
MAKSIALAEGLQESLVKALHAPHSYQDLNRLIQVCHALALVTLRQRVSGRFASVMHGISLSQLAFDSIADLFMRDENGHLVKITSYFGAFQPENLTNEQVLQHLRRLVGGTVHQALCRVYTEIDPTLGKILRNVKLAVQSLVHFKQVDQFGDACITPAFCDSLEYLASCPFDELERGILTHATRVRTIPDLLSGLSLYLRQQSEYSRVVSVIDIARVFRSTLLRLAEGDVPCAMDASDQVSHPDLGAIIAWVCDGIQRRMMQTYVARGKTSEDMPSMYRRTMEQYLQRKLDGQDGEVSLRALFCELNPDIPKSEYMRVHRSRLEYMTRIAERLILERLQE